MNNIQGKINVPDKIIGNTTKQAIKITGSASKPSGNSDYISKKYIIPFLVVDMITPQIYTYKEVTE